MSKSGYDKIYLNNKILLRKNNFKIYKKMQNIKNLTLKKKKKKIIFTGAASLIDSNLSNIKPCFGREIKYLKLK